MGRTLSYLLLICLVFSSCGNNEEEYSNLREYLELNSDWGRSTAIIACAAGGGEFTAANPEAPISIFFYPETTAYDFKYFETDNAEVNEKNTSNFKEVELESSDVFNGYLRRFAREMSDRNRWAIVSYRLNGEIWTCQPILLKAGEAPTPIVNDAVTIDETHTLNPKFSWVDEYAESNDIYFQVISDSSDDLVTGTYTFDMDFNFYEPEEFTPNITNPLITPTLKPGEFYNFTLMGVGEDNWVNMMSVRSFALD